jgi:predicted Holliday junction resolvase-like endonuclease
MDPLIAFAVGCFVAAILTVLLLHKRAEDIRARALTGSRAALRGRIVEQVVPLLGDFPYDPSDARFLGAPIDYVIFDGAADGGEIEIVFIEVKSGRARLSDVELRVREAIGAGRVRHEILRFE